MANWGRVQVLLIFVFGTMLRGSIRNEWMILGLSLDIHNGGSQGWGALLDKGSSVGSPHNLACTILSCYSLNLTLFLSVFIWYGLLDLSLFPGINDYFWLLHNILLYFYTKHSRDRYLGGLQQLTLVPNYSITQSASSYLSSLETQSILTHFVLTQMVSSTNSLLS